MKRLLAFFLAFSVLAAITSPVFAYERRDAVGPRYGTPGIDDRNDRMGLANDRVRDTADDADDDLKVDNSDWN